MEGGSYKFSKKKIDELLEKYTYVIRIIYIYDKYICILHKKNSSKIVGKQIQLEVYLSA